MNCSNCGKFISSAEKFCPACGTAVNNQTPRKGLVCPVCETLNPADATNCAICGTDISSSSYNQGSNNQPNRQGAEALFCMHCGAQNSATDAFCSECGKNLKEKTEPVVTPHDKKRPEKSYTPLIIALIIVALLSVGVAVFVVFSDGLFVSDNDPLTPQTTETATEAPTEEPTEEPTERPTPKPTPTPTPTPTPEPYDVEHYSYYRDYISDLSYYFDYPVDTTPTSHTDSKFHRKCFNTYDGGMIHICGTDNPSHTPQTIADGFKRDYPGTTDSYVLNYDNCSVTTINGNIINYCYYYVSSSGKVRGFEMSYHKDYTYQYEEYARHMRASLSY